VLRALTRLFTFGAAAGDPAQLALPLDGGPPRTADELLDRLRALGLTGIARVRLTRNRTVMVSFKDGELRVHQGYLDAPPAVHAAIVAFVSGRTRAARRAAQRAILAHPVARPERRRRAERTHPADEDTERVLAEWHARYNAAHFGGALGQVRVRVSRRLHTRLGHYTAATAGGDPAEIVIGQRHVKRHGWDEALHTLLHEMVHQWQDETNHPLDHGAAFRRKAREVGITPAARRAVAPLPARRAGGSDQAAQPSPARHFAAANGVDNVQDGRPSTRAPSPASPSSPPDRHGH
jgi:hypothetical protein